MGACRLEAQGIGLATWDDCCFALAQSPTSRPLYRLDLGSSGGAGGPSDVAVAALARALPRLRDLVLPARRIGDRGLIWCVGCIS